ncbi:MULTISPECIES: helix-turn-helix domain-containing protein [Enterobacteriaceae]|uniref:helix-turn-helix domain-containing protein n=1 Tax=Enterobacteriaceae TaxID=543 RepID=UPI00034F1506|nr:MULTISPECIES: helix-turn-helix transcriptional regulator [Enterobacteriaceae]AGN83856.1 AraC family transcriptional regulator [Enterobacter sp. R4-368]MCZ3382071.1 helix-turn-helix transcriptional regulator [Kosakonia sp. SOY2]PDO89786.1 AraC family transcriptional regulator [Kosakonia sacchari]QHM94639.1 helix-turn-helix transcriptional regulator [Kosakonia sacchari]
MCSKLVLPPRQPISGQPAPVLMTLPRPVYFRSYPLRGDTGVDMHEHPFAEFLYAREGSMRVEIEGKTLVVPVLYGVWIPARVPHRLLAGSDVLLESLYVEADFATIPFSGSKVVVVSDFVREYIHYATQNVPEKYDDAGDDAQLVQVLISLLRRLPDAGLSVSWPVSPLLTRVCSQIQKTPGDAHSIEQWASCSGMSVRTFSRRFKKETGVAFSEWKKRVRLLESVVMLKNKRSVTQVALELGYSSPASFTFAFRAMFGVPPTRY